ncbi:MAG: hypothetical protein FWD61_05085 [Phycisphaerales bacterium]|nr:hypothetical protein [Phycisphaerales bacterium]
MTRQKQAIILPGQNEGVAAPPLKIQRRAVERLCDYGGNFDILHGDPSEHNLGKYDLVILLGDTETSWVRDRLPGDTTKTLGTKDSFAVVTLRDQPLIVAATGNGPRGMLYAAYRLADMLKVQDSLKGLRVVKTPLVPERVALVTPTVLGGEEYKPGLFYRTMRELPRYGYTAVQIIAGGQCGTPVARNAHPILIDASDNLTVNRFQVIEWRKFFAEMSEYGLDVFAEAPPLIPHGFDEAAVEAFYRGGPEPKGFLPAVAVLFEKYLTTLLDTFPEIKGVVTSSTEGSEYGRYKRYFNISENFSGSNVSRDPKALSAQYETNEKILRVYLDVMQRVCRERGVKAGFWSHIYGITSDGMSVMRRVVYDYPYITCIEDDYWNNNLWIYDLPVMNYLSDAAKQEAVKHNFGMSQWVTDAEYYGGASLPNAYPDPIVFSAKEAARLGARVMQQRLNLHDRTPYGTLFNMAEIIPFASSRQLWSGAEDIDALWDEWAVRRFGREAAGNVVKALKNSKAIIFDGLQINGSHLMMHSAIEPFHWAPVNGAAFKLFGKPGVRLINKKPGDVIHSGEQYLYQMKTTPISISDYRKNNAFALQKVNESRELLRAVESKLNAEDYRMLMDAFDDGVIVLGMLLRLGEAAYAANLVLDNFDGESDPKALLRRRLSELAEYREKVILPRGSDLMNPPLYESLGKIMDSYKTLVVQQ